MVVVVVDDAHWADRPSLSALVFALRRLVADRCWSLIGVRDAVTGPAGEPAPGRRRAAGAPPSRCPGSTSRSCATSRRSSDSPLSPAAARRLRDGTQGNPLHARALLEEFPAQAWGPGERPLPSPRSFRLVVKRPLVRLLRGRPRPRRRRRRARHAQPAPAGGAAWRGWTEPLAPLDEATAAGLLRSPARAPRSRVAFPHPLVRSAVHDSLGVARRSALHTAAAALVDASPSAVLRHRVAAATVPDAALAADLEAVRRAGRRQRQAWPAATASLVEAARQSPARGRPAAARAAGRHLDAAERRRGERGGRTAARSPDFAPGAQRDSVLGALAMAAGRPPPRRRSCAARGRRCTADTDPELRGHDRPAERDALLRAPGRRGHRHVVRAGAGAHRPGHGHPLGRQHLPGARPRLRGPHRRVVRRRRRRGRPGLRLAGAPLGPRHAAPGGGRPRRRPRRSRRRGDDGPRAGRAEHGGVLLRLPGARGVPGGRVGRGGRARRAGGRRSTIESDFGFTRSMVVGIAALVPAARGEWEGPSGRWRARSRGADDYERSVVAVAMSPGPDRRGPRRSRGGARRPRAGAPLPVPRRGRRARLLGVAGPLRGGARRRRAGRGGRRAARSRTRSAPPPAGRQSSIARLARARGRVEAALGRAEQAEAAFTARAGRGGKRGVPVRRGAHPAGGGGVPAPGGAAAAGRRAADRRAAGLPELGAAPYAERCARELAASGLRPGPRRGPRRDAG